MIRYLLNTAFRRTSGLLHHLLAVLCHVTVTVCGWFDPQTLFRKWRNGRYGYRYSTDRNGSVIYRPNLWSSVKELVINACCPARRELLVWTQAQIPSFRLDDFGRGWTDGIALCALLETLCPGSCPRYDLLRATHAIYNCRLALKTANKFLGIPLTLTSSEELATYNTHYRATLARLISLIRWSAAQRAVQDKTWTPSSHSPVHPPPYRGLRSCSVSGAGLAVGIVGKTSKIDVHVPSDLALDLRVVLQGPSGQTTQEDITRLFPKKPTSVDHDHKDARAVSLWRVGASKALSARLRSAFKGGPPICETSEAPKIQIQYQTVKEGHIIVKYVPWERGTYSLRMLWHKKPMFKAPYTIQVLDTLRDLNAWDRDHGAEQHLSDNLLLECIDAVETQIDSAKSQQVPEPGTPDHPTSEPCGVTAAVLNRTSKVQRSICRIGGSTSGVLPRQTTIKRRTVLKRVITTGGKEIVLENIQPSSQSQSPSGARESSTEADKPQESHKESPSSEDGKRTDSLDSNYDFRQRSFDSTKLAFSSPASSAYLSITEGEDSVDFTDSHTTRSRPKSQRLRSSASLPSLNLSRQWKAFDIDTDNTHMSPGEMEDLSIAAQEPPQKSIDIETPGQNHNGTNNVTPFEIERHVDAPPTVASDNFTPVSVRQTKDIPQHSPSLKRPKATKEQWTQVTYEEIKRETGWKRPTTYVLPRRQPIHEELLKAMGWRSNPVMVDAIVGPASRLNSPAIPEDGPASDTGPASHQHPVTLSSTQTAADDTERNQETTEDLSSSAPAAPQGTLGTAQGTSSRLGRLSTPGPAVRGHRALRRTRYRGKISLDPLRLLSGDTDSRLAPADDLMSPGRRRKVLKTKSTLDGGRKLLWSPTKQDSSMEADRKIFPRVRFGCFQKKRVKFCKKIALYRRSSSRSSRNSRQSQDECRSAASAVKTCSNKNPFFSHLPLPETAPMETEPVHEATRGDDSPERSPSGSESQDSLNNDGFGVSAATRKDLLDEVDAFSKIGLAPSRRTSLELARRRRMSLPDCRVSTDGLSTYKLKRSMSVTGAQLVENSPPLHDIPTEKPQERVADYIQTLLGIAEMDLEEDDPGSPAWLQDLQDPDEPPAEPRIYQVPGPGTAGDEFFLPQENVQCHQVVDLFDVPDPFRCKAFGPGLFHGAVGVVNMFQVNTPTRGNENLVVSITGPRPRTVRETNVVFTGDDLYEVSYQVSQPGLYVITVKWGDFNIPSSPFVCQVSFD